MSEDIKAKIRERYKGNANANIEVIPAIEQPSFYEDFSEKRVAVYARVSTGSANQTSSYELQKGYYEQDVTRHPGWKLVRIYAETYHPIMRQCTRRGCTFLCTGCI